MVYNTVKKMTAYTRTRETRRGQSFRRGGRGTAGTRSERRETFQQCSPCPGVSTPAGEYVLGRRGRGGGGRGRQVVRVAQRTVERTSSVQLHHFVGFSFVGFSSARHELDFSHFRWEKRTDPRGENGKGGGQYSYISLRSLKGENR